MMAINYSCYEKININDVIIKSLQWFIIMLQQGTLVQVPSASEYLRFWACTSNQVPSTTVWNPSTKYQSLSSIFWNFITEYEYEYVFIKVLFEYFNLFNI